MQGKNLPANSFTQKNFEIMRGFPFTMANAMMYNDVMPLMDIFGNEYTAFKHGIFSVLEPQDQMYCSLFVGEYGLFGFDCDSSNFVRRLICLP